MNKKMKKKSFLWSSSSSVGRRLLRKMNQNYGKKIFLQRSESGKRHASC